MGITASELRANVYQLIDRVIETGQPLEIERNGHIVRIIAVEPVSRLAQLPKRSDFVRGDPEELVHLDWSAEWTP